MQEQCNFYIQILSGTQLIYESAEINFKYKEHYLNEIKDHILESSTRKGSVQYDKNKNIVFIPSIVLMSSIISFINIKKEMEN